MAGSRPRAVGDIVLQLLLPFVAGQLARPWIGGWAARNRTLLGLVDRGSILLVVYAAFSEGVTHGIWHQVDLAQLAMLLLVDAALLARGAGLTDVRQPAAGLQPRRRDHHRVLRLEEEPGERPADGERAVRRPAGRR